MTNLSQQPLVEASGWKLIFVHSYLASKPRLCTDEHLPLPVIRAVYETRKAHLSTPAEAVLSRGFRKMLFHPPFSTLWRSWLLSESLPVQVLVLALSLLTQLFLESILLLTTCASSSVVAAIYAAPLNASALSLSSISTRVVFFSCPLCQQKGETFSIRWVKWESL